MIVLEVILSIIVEWKTGVCLFEDVLLYSFIVKLQSYFKDKMFSVILSKVQRCG